MVAKIDDSTHENEIGAIDSLIERCEYQSAITKILEGISDDIPNQERYIRNHRLSFVYNCLGEYDKTIQLYTSIDDKDPLTISITALKLEILHAYYRLDQYNQAQELIKILEEEITQLPQDDFTVRQQSLLDTNHVYLLVEKGDLDTAYNIAFQNYQNCNKLDDLAYLSRAHYLLGRIHLALGDINSAKMNHERSLEIRQKLGNKFSLAHSLFSMGIVNRFDGKLEEAHKYFLEAHEIRLSLGNQQDLAWTKLNLGDISLDLGNIEDAQMYYQDSLAIFNKINYQLGSIYSLNRISGVHRHHDQYDLAVSTLDRAFRLTESVDNEEIKVVVLFDLIFTKSQLSPQDPTLDTYLLRLERIVSKNNVSSFDQISKLAKALILNKQSGSRNKADARAMFKDITNDTIYNFYFTKIAITEYGKILADELKGYLGEFDFVGKLEDLSSTITDEQFQYSYPIIAENYLSEGVSALDDVNIAKTREMLSFAEYFSNFLGLHRKGDTPFRILFTTIMKERSLGEISDILNITKGGLNIPLKILVDLDLIKVSREEQVRSATMLKKYYSLGDKGKELLKPLIIRFQSNLDPSIDVSASFEEHLMLPRMFIKINQGLTKYLNLYQNFFERQVLLNPFEDYESNQLTEDELNQLKSMFNDESEISTAYMFLSQVQFQKYRKLHTQFMNRVNKEILNDEIYPLDDEKNIVVSHTTLPMRDLINLESQIKSINQRQKQKKDT